MPTVRIRVAISRAMAGIYRKIIQVKRGEPKKSKAHEGASRIN